MYKPFDPNKAMRNYNCRVRESDINGVKQVCLDNRFLHVAVLAGKGTDIVEFLYKPMDMDFLFHTWTGVKNREATSPTPQGVFFDTYEGGWQELFPSIGPATAYRGADLPFHGEVHSLDWDYRIERDAEEEVTVKFWVRTPRSPYLLEKWMTINALDAALYIRERVTNEGLEPMQFMWGHHPALGPAFLDSSCTIVLSGENLSLHPYPNTQLKTGGAQSFPHGTLLNGAPIDLRRVLPPEDKCLMEFGVSGFDEGLVEVRNHNYNLAFGLKWDESMLPYLWIWEPDCGSEGYPFYGRDYCLGIEPWSALPDSLSSVAARGAGVHIAPGETKELTLTAYARAFQP